MKGSRLAQLVSPGTDIEATYAEFRQTRPDGDSMAFARWLHDRNYLTPDALKEYLLAGDLSFTLSEVGSRIRGPASSRFELLGLLGRGAMGEVHVARDTDLNRNVAVKLMDPKLSSDPRLARRFYTEAQVTAQLDHPAIVPVFGVERTVDGSLGYAMRIVRGRTLRDFLVETRAFYEKGAKPDAAHSLQARLLIFEDLCNAMHYAHSRGVIHRDLKPDNVMVGPYGEVLVMDWGIAKVIGTPDETGPHLAEATAGGTEIGDSIGTPRYMSPEQALGKNDKLDGRADQYALGLLLFELVALKSANPGTSAVTCWSAARKGQTVPFEHAYGEKLPRDLRAIVEKATARKRSDRYRDVGQLAEDVRRFLRDEELIARPDGMGQRLMRAVGRNRQAVLGVMATLASLLMVVITGSVVLAALGYVGSAWYADRREQRLGRVMARVAEQGHRMDSEFARYVGELRGLQGTAAYALSRQPTIERATYFVDDFRAGNLPPDAVQSAVYGQPASLGWPDNVGAPGFDRAANATLIAQLQTLQPQMLAMLSRSVSPTLEIAPAEERRKLLLDRPAPMIWTYIATEHGILTGLPGVGDYPPDYDPRKQPWYALGIAQDDLRWEAAVDESGQGLLLSATLPVREAGGRKMGVVGLDIGVQHVTDELLAPPGLDGPVQALLIDPAGAVLVDTANPDAAAQKRAFGYPAVVRRIAEGETGGWLEAGDELVLWTRVEQIGWTYVVIGKVDDLVQVF